jgi:hypothetical protein
MNDGLFDGVIQGRVQDLQKGGAEPITRAIFLATPPLTRWRTTENAVLGLISMRNCCLESKF